MGVKQELRFQLFGRFGLEVSGRRVSGLRCHRTQELLGRLLLNRSRPLRRETLALEIWGDEGGSKPRRKLRQALWQCQSALTAADDRLAGLVQHLGTEWVQIDPEASCETDVEVLERAVEMSSSLRETEIRPGTLSPLKASLDLYRGEFLEGHYSDWCILERERLNDLYVCLLERLMEAYERRGEYRIGIELGLRVLQEDRARERAHRRLMRLYYLAGDRAGALRQFARCASAMLSELDVQPSRSTLELERRIRLDEPVGSAPGRPATPNEVEAATLLQRLFELRDFLSSTGSRVESEIERLRLIVLRRD